MLKCQCVVFAQMSSKWVTVCHSFNTVKNYCWASDEVSGMDYVLLVHKNQSE